jgi:hypothetical protein
MRVITAEARVSEGKAQSFIHSVRPLQKQISDAFSAKMALEHTLGCWRISLPGCQVVLEASSGGLVAALGDSSMISF